MVWKFTHWKPAVDYFMSGSSGSGWYHHCSRAPEYVLWSMWKLQKFLRQFSRTRSSAGTDINGIMPVYPNYRFGFQSDAWSRIYCEKICWCQSLKARVIIHVKVIYIAKSPHMLYLILMNSVDKKRSHMKSEVSELRWHENEHLESKVKALTELNQDSHSVEIFMFLSSYLVK